MVSERIKKIDTRNAKGRKPCYIEGSISGEVCFKLAKRKGLYFLINPPRS